MFVPISSLRRFNVMSLGRTVRCTGVGYLFITVEIISFVAGTTKLSPNIER